MRRRLRTPAALALIAVVLAGCSAGSADDAGSSDAGEGGSATTAAATARDEAVAFSRCMRDNGVAEFPDPDASGEMTVDGVLNGSSLDPSSPSWEQAMVTCKDLQPPGFTGDGEVTDAKQAARLAFAKCIRLNGVEDFPDPARDAPMIDTRRIPSASTDAGIAALNAAMEACRDLGDGARG